jgi:hypothetical protein
MKQLTIFEETEDLVGMEIVEDEKDASVVILRDIDKIDNDPAEFYILRREIPKLIEGLKQFMED